MKRAVSSPPPKRAPRRSEAIMTKRYQGRFAVITGASSGIGLELAKVFAGEGFDLLISARDASALHAVAASLRQQGAQVNVAATDLSTYEGVEQLYTAIQGAGRAVDAIAINAGRGVGGPFIKTSLKSELELIQLNITSTVHLAKRVAADMAARGSGKILFTGSVAGTAPLAFEAVYAASKAFVNSFARALGAELKDTGVTTTLLMPNATDTDFFRRADLENTKVGAGKKDDPATVARQGFDALMAGESSVFGGSLASKLQGNLNHLLPEDTKAALFRHHSEPMSATSKEDAR
jgi:short-subunit dehydrogenase